MSDLSVEFPAKIVPVLFTTHMPDGTPVRNKVLDGGRGSAKSHSVAKYEVLKAYESKKRILNTREMQNSIRDSVYQLICDKIQELNLGLFFTVKQDTIECKRTGSNFLFKGLHHNISEIKSLEGINICWNEEAQRTTKYSAETLIPTIRKPGSEIIWTYNPEEEKQYSYQTFSVPANRPPGTLYAKVNWYDNPWFPEVLRREMEYCKRVDYDRYLHIWEGEPRGFSDALIFKNKFEITDFTATDNERFFYGVDFGYSVDPTCLVRCFIRDRSLYVDWEAYAVGIEITELAPFFRIVPGTDRWSITADSARPDTISYLQQQGFNIDGAEKGKGSVEDGLMFLRSFERIYIHPRCRGTIGDISHYCWKKDRNTEEILPIPEDRNNHSIDALRYALESYVRGNVSIYDVMPGI